MRRITFLLVFLLVAAVVALLELQMVAATPAPSTSRHLPPVPATTWLFQDGVGPTTSYTGTADTTISTWSGYPYANLGGPDWLKVGEDGNSDNMRILLRFALDDLPADAWVSQATLGLRIYDTGYDDNPRDLVVHTASREWWEGDGWSLLADGRDQGATWMTARPGITWTLPGGDFDPAELDRVTLPANPAGQWIELDVTGAVQDWAGGAPNYGFLLEPDRGPWQYNEFRSSEFADPAVRPRLRVTFYSCLATGDVDRSGRVDILDIGAVAASWQQPTFPPEHDRNGDGAVDIDDLTLVALAWHGHCRSTPPTPTPTLTPTLTPTPTPTATPTQTPLPQPFSVPLRVRETAGVSRTGEPVTSGVPIPRDVWLTDAGQLRVLDPLGAPVPAQFAVLARWGGPPADSTKGIQWVLVDFQASVGANQEVTYTLETGGGGAVALLDPAALVPPGIDLPGRGRGAIGDHRSSVHTPGTGLDASIVLTDSADALLVDTGPARFRLRKAGFNLIDQVWLDRDGDGAVDDALLAAAAGPLITAGGGPYRADLGPVDEFAVELAGPLHTVVRVRGRHANAAGDVLLAYTTRLHFYAGQSDVRVFYGVWNDRPSVNDGTGQPAILAFGSPNTILFDNLSLDLTLDASGPLTYTLGGAIDEAWNGPLSGEAVLYQDSSGGVQWDHPAISAETTFRGFTAEANGTTLHPACDEGATPAECRSLGWIDLRTTNGGVAAGIRHFWQNYPNRLAMDNRGTLHVQPFPGQYAVDFELRVGERKTHELLYHFETGQEDVDAAMRRLHEPLRAWAPATWYAESAALQRLVPYDPLHFADYEGHNDAAILDPNINFDILHEGVTDGAAVYLPKAEQWGWRNFGDTVAEDETNADWPPIFHNGQYDHPYYFLAHALRTLETPHWQRWWALGIASARHQADIDIIHSYCTGIEHSLMDDPLCLDSSQGPPYPPGWSFGGRLTNQWHADPSPDIHRHALIDYWSGGLRGLLWAYYLTGEGEMRDGWLELAENARWRLANSPCDPSCGPGYSHNGLLGNDLRGPAYGLEIMADAFAATGDRAYLTWARDVISDSHPSQYFVGDPGFTVDRGLSPAGETVDIARLGMLAKSVGHYLDVIHTFNLEDPYAESWLRLTADFLVKAWDLDDPLPFCTVVGANGGCDRDDGGLQVLFVADGLAWAAAEGHPTAGQKAGWDAVALAAWQNGTHEPWSGWVNYNFMTAKSQVLFGINGHRFMRYALEEGLLSK